MSSDRWEDPNTTGPWEDYFSCRWDETLSDLEMRWGKEFIEEMEEKIKEGEEDDDFDKFYDELDEFEACVMYRDMLGFEKALRREDRKRYLKAEE